ncbi:GAL4 enhancer protein [Yamadazyma tenuis]|uniref:Nascent polypeptide-associated complex subunit alpha n=1 Tax=Candida tenuis (strain ATCC 10573 / BCRC 21748 / CBS 615 / JCM 9827 / NBRC 10315 / NRRL Y-1498 / VKM Y-70) TaxID=590646 RepID=G3BA00_CANTC|nr:nascent polypeptide-associated complex, alpha subunit [Yamadazyma tenuis ATCC 10573]EGV62495.1 nascent polypeptide-associated complex, alpha subunit [Yamadazyma tenuis ATCC 10573]WEJ92581.1 GAL4 enhancer protein [Yamadazyma tenuis]
MSIEEIPQGADIQVISKNEKKARDAIKKFNLKQIKGISRVTFKQRGNLIYAIDTPEVYKSVSGTYIVFGEAKVDDINQRFADQAAAGEDDHEGHDHSHEGHDHSHEDKSPESITADLEKASLGGATVEEEDDDEEVDDTGLDPKDIEIIIEQTKVSRAKAVKALRKHDGDMVNAIMEFA